MLLFIRSSLCPSLLPSLSVYPSQPYATRIHPSRSHVLLYAPVVVQRQSRLYRYVPIAHRCITKVRYRQCASSKLASQLCPASDECLAGYRGVPGAIVTASPAGNASRPHVLDPRRPHCTHSTASTYAIKSAALGKSEASQCVCTRSGDTTPGYATRTPSWHIT